MYWLAVFSAILAAVNAGIIGQPTITYSVAPGIPPGFAPGSAYSSAPAQFAPTAYSFAFHNRGSSVVPYGPFGAVAAPALSYAAPPGVGINAGAYTLAAPAGVSYVAVAPAGIALNTL